MTSNMINNNSDYHSSNSGQSTPRSSIGSNYSPRSSGSGSSNAYGYGQNISYKQKKLRIPSERRKANAAVLQAPLIKDPVLPNLVPLPLGKHVVNMGNLDILNRKHSIESLEIDTEPLFGNSEKQGFVPHPPDQNKPRNKVKGRLRHENDSQTVSGSDESLLEESTGVLLEENQTLRIQNWSRKSQAERKSLELNTENDENDSYVRETKTVKNAKDTKHGDELGEGMVRNSDNDSSLLLSYEAYLRQLSKNEEEESSDVGFSKAINKNNVLEDRNSESDSSTDSDSSSITVSSLSDDDDEDTLQAEITDTNFEPLYSLPIKSTKTNGNNKSLIHNDKADLDSFIHDKYLLETSDHDQLAQTNKSLLEPELRTQSVPDLRTGKSFRTFDTWGYMCPKKLPQIDTDDRGTSSSPDIKEKHFNMKYRPLPTIPKDNIANGRLYQRDTNDDENDETIYERVATQSMSPTLNSSRKSKMSFRDVAGRVVSLMPRLTTRDARTREGDRQMEDILRYLPDKTLRVYCSTWNMKGIKVLPDTLDDYILPHESLLIQDIYAIGCQEGTPFRKEWEICLQETLGPSYVLMYSGNFGVLHLSIFIRRELVWFCTGIEQDTFATRIAHKIKTKGAIAVCFNIFGTSLLFINSHFASDQSKVQERLNDYRSICRSLSIPFGEEGNSLKEGDVTSRFDRVFWFGDFNFRVEKNRAETDKIFANRSFEDNNERKSHIIEELKQYDQLSNLMNNGKIFHGFKEAPIRFLPTYKFDVNTDSYDSSSKARVPSWTDRVLYKSRQHGHIKVAAYNSCTTIRCSDHRPVYCILEAKIEPMKKNVRVPMAMFDRDIYVEANLRRSAPRGSQQSSNVCTIL